MKMNIISSSGGGTHNQTTGPRWIVLPLSNTLYINIWLWLQAPTGPSVLFQRRYAAHSPDPLSARLSYVDEALSSPEEAPESGSEVSRNAMEAVRFGGRPIVFAMTTWKCTMQGA
jgi:hypothetical protein